MPVRRPPRSRRGERPVARQVVLLQALTVALLVMGAIALAGVDARSDARERAAQRAVAVATTVADSPTVRTALAERDRVDPTPVLQPWAEEVRRDTETEFVVIMALDRTRYTHPDPSRIGRAFVGDLGSAPRGRVFTQQYTGTLGPSVRAVVPVEDGAPRRVVALVSVGIAVDDIDRALRHDVAVIVGYGAAALVLGLIAAALLGRRLHRMTHGLGERELARMYEYYSAVLHSVREGLVLLDPDGRVQLVNDEARRLLDLPDDAVGRPIDDLGLAPGLVAAARDGRAATDDLYLAGERIVVVSSSPATWAGRAVGAVVTLRDHTELRAVTGELEAVRRLSEAVRARNHESANRLHTVVSLIEMGRTAEAVEFATEELLLAQQLTDEVVAAVGEPVVAALLLAKSAEAAERGVVLDVVGSLDAAASVPARDLVTVLGNLVDNALDALDTPAPPDATTHRIEVRLTSAADEAPRALTITVGDSGTGLQDDDAPRALDRGWTTKAGPGAGRGLGLALVAQVARRHGGDVRIARSPLGGAEVVVVLRPEHRDAARTAPR